jgi:hypothetical protein
MCKFARKFMGRRFMKKFKLKRIEQKSNKRVNPQNSMCRRRMAGLRVTKAMLILKFR